MGMKLQLLVKELPYGITHATSSNCPTGLLCHYRLLYVICFEELQQFVQLKDTANFQCSPFSLFNGISVQHQLLKSAKRLGRCLQKLLSHKHWLSSYKYKYIQSSK